MADRTHRFSGDRGQVRVARAGLVAIDLLQRENVGVELLDRVDEPLLVNRAIVNAAAVQDVECGHPDLHGY